MSLNAGVIGVGVQGRRIIKALASIHKLKLISLLDKSDIALSQINVDGLKKYKNIELFFNENNFDLVCIATNGPSHCDLVLKAISNNVK